MQFGTPDSHIPIGDNFTIFMVQINVSRHTVFHKGDLEGCRFVDLFRGENHVEVRHVQHGFRVLVLSHKILERVFRFGKDEFAGVVTAVFFAALHKEALHVAADVGLSLWMAELFSLVFSSDPLLD